jgi:iron complex outermembrane receptor protein
VTWRVGGVFDITRAIAAYAQITSGVDPLSSLITLPLSQRDAKLTRAMQYEVGLKSQFLDGRGQATLALYYLTKEDLLSNDPTNPDGFLQVGKQSAYGVEVALGFRLADSLTIDANVAVLLTFT